MITKDPGIKTDTYFGLSTDEKPITNNIKNASIFYEMDTGNMFMYDKQNKIWKAQ